MKNTKKNKKSALGKHFDMTFLETWVCSANPSANIKIIFYSVQVLQWGMPNFAHNWHLAAIINGTFIFSYFISFESLKNKKEMLSAVDKFPLGIMLRQESLNVLVLIHCCFQVSNNNQTPKAATKCVLWKKVFLEISQISQENTCARVSFFNKVAGPKSQTCSFIKKETLTQVFSCEFFEISKKTIFTEYLWTTASEAHWL